MRKSSCWSLARLTNARDVAARVADRFQHLDRGLIRAAVQWAPQRIDAGRDRRIEIRVRRPDHSYRRRRTVLLVVGVQDQQLLQRVDDGGGDLIWLRRDREHHAQEVLDQVERVVGVQERLADRLLVRVRRDRRDLGDQPDDRLLDLFGVVRVFALLVERRHRAHDRRQRRHRVCVLRKAVVEALHVLVQHRVRADLVAELVPFGHRRKLAVNEQPRGLEERGVLLVGERLDVVAAVAEDPGVAVDVGDRRLGGTRVDVAVIERDEAALGPQLGDVDRVLAFGARHDRQLDLLVTPAQDCHLIGHVRPLRSW